MYLCTRSNPDTGFCSSSSSGVSSKLFSFGGGGGGAASFLNAQGATPVTVTGGCLEPAPPLNAQGATPVVVSGGCLPPPPPGCPGFQSPARNLSDVMSGGTGVGRFVSSASGAGGGTGAFTTSNAGICFPGPQSSSACSSKTSGLAASSFSKTRQVILFTVGFQKTSPSLTRRGSMPGISESAKLANSFETRSSFHNCSTDCRVWPFCDVNNRRMCLCSWGIQTSASSGSRTFKISAISWMSKTSFGVLDSCDGGK
mmetsp:Transcript_49061/g.116824  ORF Transcript_49061/g.116824 Transcript_49061/m.116824 type:complete len:256 (-) Transcript_49061:733-1500(-)